MQMYGRTLKGNRAIGYELGSIDPQAAGPPVVKFVAAVLPSSPHRSTSHNNRGHNCLKQKACGMKKLREHSGERLGRSGSGVRICPAPTNRIMQILAALVRPV